MISIKINIGMEEYLDFNRVALSMNKTFKKLLIFFRFILPLIFFISAVFNIFSSDYTDWIWFGIVVVVSILWIFFCPVYFKWSALRKVKKVYLDPLNKHMFEQREIMFLDDKIKIETPGGNSETKWDKFICFKETERGFYLFHSLLNGFIISKVQISPEEQKQIREILKTKIHSNCKI